MSKKDDLIAKLCPDGVRHEPMWRMTTWDKRFNGVDNAKQPSVIKYKYLLEGDLKPLVLPDGNIKIFTTNVSDIWTSMELVGI